MRRGPDAAGWESCPAGAWLASPAGALPHGKLCWGLTAPRTHSPGAGCRHPGCTEPRRGLVLGNRSLLSPFHLLLPNWGGVNSLAPSAAAESGYKAALHPPARCCSGTAELLLVLLLHMPQGDVGGGWHPRTVPVTVGVLGLGSGTCPSHGLWFARAGKL